MKRQESHTKKMRWVICLAMIDLLNQKDFEQISIKELVAQAEIQRSTFYHHFRDKYEVVMEINQQLATVIVDNFMGAVYHQETLDELTHAKNDGIYAHVAPRLLNLHIENIDLHNDLKDVFAARYHTYYPDCSDLEAALATQNFICMVDWFWNNNYEIPINYSKLFPKALISWLSHITNISTKQLEQLINQENA